MSDWWKSLFGSKKTAPPAAAPQPVAPADVAVTQAPFEILRVHGKDALRTLRDLRAQRPGFVPVAFGSPPEYERMLETMQLNAITPEECLRRGLALDVDAWIQARIASDPAHYAMDFAEPGNASAAEPLSVAHEPLTGEFRKDIVIGIVPAAEPWQVPAVLRPGSWNECPDPDVHVAFFKRWHERHGAVVTSLSGDVIEFTVERPPVTIQAADALAREQFVYCADTVHQGAGSLANLARALHGAPNWHFWWD